MPTGVFDASLITQRARAKAESNSFINRIQNPTNPTTSYGPLTGIYDNSEINRVNNGQMKYFQRNGACTVAYVGCPCTVLTPSGQVANNVVVVAPGVVDGIQGNYGSVIVTWNVPTGTAPFTYTLLAESQTTPANNRIVSNIPTESYTFPTYTAPPPPEQLVAGDRYLFKVTAFNPLPSPSAGSALSLFNAPYGQPAYTGNTPTSTPTAIGITINYSSYTAFSRTNGTLFDSTGTSIGTGSADATTFTITSGLLAETEYTNCYFRLTAGNNTSSNSGTFTFTTVPNQVGPVPSITSVYGTDTNGVDVTWTAPTTGGTPTSYTVTATPSSGSPVIVTSITTRTYSFAVGDLIEGTQYTITVIGVNAAGNGVAYSGTPSTIYAPFEAPVVSSIDSSAADPNTIFIRINQYTPFNPTSYIIRQYVNNSTTFTTITDSYSQSGSGVSIILSSGLSTNNVYEFQVQLRDISNNRYSSFTVKSNPATPVYPAGPTMQTPTNITSTTAQINYANYATTGGFDLTTGDAQAIITGPVPGSYSVQPGSLNNTSVIVTGLTPVTQYLDSDPSLSLKISFRKTIQGNVITSATSPAVTFETNGIAPTSVFATAPVTSATIDIAQTAEIAFTSYVATNPDEFDWNDAEVYINGVIYTDILSFAPPNVINVRGLSPATTYPNFQILLKNPLNNPPLITDRSAIFTVITKADAPTDLSFDSSTYSGSSGTSDLILSFSKPSGLGTLTTATASYENGSNPFTNVSIYTQNQVRISLLTPGTTFNNITITVSDGTYTSINSTVLSSATTAAAPDPPPADPTDVTPGTADYTTQPITWSNSYTYTLTSANVVQSSTTFNYQSLSQSGLTITGLVPGNTYSNLTVSVATNGGSSNPSSIPTFVTNSLPTPDVTGYVGTYVAGPPQSVTITVNYTTYPVQPISGALYNNSGQLLGTDTSPGTSSLTITGLTPGLTSAGYIVLTFNSSTFGNYSSPNSNTFAFSTTVILNAVQNPLYGPNPITITFSVVPDTYSVSGATLYYSGGSVDATGFVTSSSLQFNLPEFTTEPNCYIVLRDNFSQPTLPSNTFSVDNRYPPPQITGTSTFSNAVSVNFTYNAFNPTGGDLYSPNYGQFSGSIVGSSPNYELSVPNLNPGTDYGECYIIITNGTYTSLQSSTFQVTTNP